ncbi:MAG: phosphoenolpyruvate--protein phosphotransferase [Deltaproteobacteria bacterium]|nr:phosphoenolpyruvate--protein phosphotransferase [Deltaproteobacteria bacterium]
MGPACVRAHLGEAIPRYTITSAEVAAEQGRLRSALRETDRQLDGIKQQVTRLGGDTLILEAYQLMLRDAYLVEHALKHIADDRVNAEWAIHRTVEGITRVFDQVENPFFRERAKDVHFVAEHLLVNLLGGAPAAPRAPEGGIVVAHDLSAADVVELRRRGVVGIVLEAGGSTSHTAIMARSLGLAMVAGVREALSLVREGDPLIVDGGAGEVIARPDAQARSAYEAQRSERAEAAMRRTRSRELPGETRDGTRVRLMANVELPEEVGAAVGHGAEGIGLYRTEFLLLGRSDWPTEGDQLAEAREVLRLAEGRAVTFRTFDLGSDKFRLPGAAEEANPAMGLRSLRLCLAEPEGFKAQLRGLLRAGQEGSLRILLPMVSGIEELRAAAAILDACVAELGLSGRPPLGVMVELPSAALTADFLAPEVDFFSVGTNDLIQYTLGVDRLNDRVNYLYHPMHPAILRLIHQVLVAGARHDKPVAVCGEMAGDPALALVLVGLGVRELSMNGAAIPEVKELLGRVTIGYAEQVAARLLSCSTAAEAAAEVERAAAEVAPSRRPRHAAGERS